MGFKEFLLRNAPFLGVGVLLTFTSSFGQTYFISIFAGEIRQEFGLSHAAWGAIYAAGTMASAVVMIWTASSVSNWGRMITWPSRPIHANCWRVSAQF